MEGPIFSATFQNIAVTAAQDLFQLLTSSTTRIAIVEIDIGQFSDAGDAQDELLSLDLVRGNTADGSGGSAVTPVNLKPWSRTSPVTVARNNTTAASGGGAIVHSTSFNVRQGWYWKPEHNQMFDDRFFVEVSQRFCVRISAPTDSLSMQGTIKWQELGLMSG